MTPRAPYTWMQPAPRTPRCYSLVRIHGGLAAPALSCSGPQVLTSPLSTTGSWLLSEVGCNTGRAVGFIPMSCTDPEDVSKGSAAALPELSKRTAPSSSSLAGTKAQHKHVDFLVCGSCATVGEYMRGSRRRI